MYQSLSFAACVDPFRSTPSRSPPVLSLPVSYRIVSYCIVSSESATIVPIRSDPPASHALGSFRVNLNFNTLSTLGSPRITDCSSGLVWFFAFTAARYPKCLACACVRRVGLCVCVHVCVQQSMDIAESCNRNNEGQR